MKQKKEIKKGVLTAKLTFFDWGWADNIIYRIKGKVNEKSKGLDMISKIKEFFGIQDNEIIKHDRKVRDEEIARIKWTRDEEGNIISPFRTKREDEE
ncbi:MAG TPA: hypothetical protein ENI29_14855 [bacterium]|nr:hypothetical protein [bacterium]